MTADAAVARRPARAALAAVAVAVGMVLFALFVHRGLPWTAASGIGLTVAAVIIGLSLRSGPKVRGLPSADLRSRLVAFVILGIVIGAAGGLLQRHHSGVAPGPADGLHLFVAVACLIGVTEELVYRGWMLERLSGLGWPAAVAITALAHGAYKTALFAWPPGSEGAGLDLARIVMWTVAGGAALGLLRVASRSVLPAVIAHAVFDAVVYSAFAAPPWWVWG